MSRSDAGGPITTTHDHTHGSDGGRRPSSPSPATRDGIWRCAILRAPRQLPSLPPPKWANPTTGANSGLDKTWGQGHPLQTLRRSRPSERTNFSTIGLMSQLVTSKLRGFARRRSIERWTRSDSRVDASGAAGGERIATKRPGTDLRRLEASGVGFCGSRSGRPQRALHARQFSTVLTELRRRLPLSLQGIDNDNDIVFINETLKAYCERANIVFTRWRRYRKDDSHLREFSSVRQYALAPHRLPQADSPRDSGGEGRAADGNGGAQVEIIRLGMVNERAEEWMSQSFMRSSSSWSAARFGRRSCRPPREPSRRSQIVGHFGKFPYSPRRR
ncbi:hypothetical protein ABIC02_007945 [Bradyrhizobium sp. RT5a]